MDIISWGTLALVAWFSPYVWPKLPVWVAQLGIYFSIFLFGISIGFLIREYISDKTLELADGANIRLHFYGYARTPQRISADNIWRWYYLQNMLSLITIQMGAQSTRTISNLFVSFDHPVKVGTLEVCSSDFTMPHLEVKEFNNRFAIIAFSEDIPVGSLSINVRAGS